MRRRVVVLLASALVFASFAAQPFVFGATAVPSASVTPPSAGATTAAATPVGTPTGTSPAATATPTVTATASPTAPTGCPAVAAQGLLDPANATNEVASLRTRTSRTFKAPSSSRLQQVIGQDSLNYRDAAGAWQPIDNTLVAGTGGTAYRNTANAYAVAFPSELSGNPVTVTSGADSVSFSLIGAHGAPSACGATATYANALPGVTLAYIATGDVVRETLTLASAAAPAIYVFNLQLGAGLTARANAGGGIDFVDGSGAMRLGFSAPVLFDSAKPRPALSRAVSLRLDTTATGQTVSLVVDPAWLADPARTFPVVIDPDVQTPPAVVTNGQDCFIDSNSPTTNRCPVGYPYNSVSWDPATGGSHSLLQFDTSIYNANFVIEDAAVLMYPFFYQDSQGIDTTGADTVSVRRLTHSWSAGSVTWNSPWTRPGGDYPPNPPEDTKTVGNDGTESSGTLGSGSAPVRYNCRVAYFTQPCAWEITAMVQGWIRGDFANDGMLFEDDQAPNTNDLRFCTTYCPGFFSSLKPVLVITYNDPGPSGDAPALGAKRYYALAGTQIDDRTRASINAMSGNLLVTGRDLALSGIGMNLTIDRSYNSLSIYKGAFGNHWAMNGGRDLFLTIIDTTVLLQANTGAISRFTRNANGTYTPGAGTDATLQKYGDGSYTVSYHASNMVNRFDANGTLTWKEDQNGNRITYAYDGTTKRLTTITDSEGRQVAFHYNGDGFIDSVTDPTGNRVWQYAYTNGNLTSVTDPVNGAAHPTRYAYNGDGNLVTVTDPNGHDTTFAYQGGARSRATSMTRKGLASGDLTTTFAYTSTLTTTATTITDPNIHQTTVAYDATAMTVTSVTDALGHHFDFQYNADKKVTSVKDAKGQTTTYTYDADNERMTAMRLPTAGLTATTTTTYDACPTPLTFPAHCFFPATVTDAQGRTVRYTYDAKGNRTQVVNDLPAGSNTTTYAYNTSGAHPNGTLASATNARQQTTTYAYTYDATNTARLTQVVATPPQVTSGTQPGNVTTAYEAVGRVRSVTDGKNQTTTLTYDALDRTTDAAYQDGTHIARTYDFDGNAITRADATGTTTFDYDALNRMTAKHLPGGATVIRYGYDGVGNPTSFQDAGGAVAYTYDAADRLMALVDPAGARTSFEYDANDDVTATHYAVDAGNPSGTATLARTYDASRRLAEIKGTKGSPPFGATLSDFVYSYTDAGNRDTMLRQTVTDRGVTTSYSYDAVNRLTGTSGAATTAYGYDAVGNRTSATVNGVATTATFNEADEETAVGATTYSYDADGNETGSSAGEARSYNAKNQTISITGLNGTLTPIGYEDAGQAERTQAGSSAYVNTSQGVSSETKAGATVYYTRMPGGKLVSQRTGSATYYYLFDGQGSVVGLVDASGNVVANYGYDPYGQTVVKTGVAADGNPWRYTGAYLDATGLYKMGERYYDAARGRFTQPDPLGSGYVYAADNPVNFVDPSGLAIVDPTNARHAAEHYGWESAESLQYHYDERGHGIEMGAANVREYAAMARDLYNEYRNGNYNNYEGRVRDNGDIIIWDPCGGALGFYDSAGESKNLFMNDNRAYFERQGSPIGRNQIGSLLPDWG